MFTDSIRKNSSIAATVLPIGAETGCLKFATAHWRGLGIERWREVLVRKWYGDMRQAVKERVYRALEISMANPSSGRWRSDGREAGVGSVGRLSGLGGAGVS